MGNRTWSLLMSVKPQFGFVVEYVESIETAKHFYLEVLGLVPEREHRDFVQFESFAIAADGPIGNETGEEVYWVVSDAADAFRELSTKAEVSLPLTQFPFGKVFGLRDPDGYSRYLVELGVNRPSEPVK